MNTAKQIVKSEYPDAWLANPGTASNDGLFYVFAQYDMSKTLATGKTSLEAWKAAADTIAQ